MEALGVEAVFASVFGVGTNAFELAYRRDDDTDVGGHCGIACF
jgi:hypothetical protein